MWIFNPLDRVRQTLFNAALSRSSKIGVYFCCYFLRYKITRADFKKNYHPDSKLSPQFKILKRLNPKEAQAFLESTMSTEKQAIENNAMNDYQKIQAQFFKSIQEYNRRLELQQFQLELQQFQDNETNQAKCIIESEQHERMQLPFPIGQPQIHKSAKRVGIKIPSPLPLFDNSPNLNRLEDWANSQLTPILRQIAQKIVAKINYIPFDTFLKRLKQMTQEFNQYLGDNPYVLLIGNFKDKGQGSSDQWVSGLALEYCELKQPAEITTVEEINPYLTTHPGIHHILLLDDAVYSGTQKDIEISRVFNQLKGNDCKLVLGVPYISRVGIKVIDSLPERHQIKVLSHEVLPMLVDALTSEENNYLIKLNCGTHPYQYITITYFSHQFSDSMSTFQAIYYGSNLVPYSIRPGIDHFIRRHGKHQDWSSYSYPGNNIPFTLRPYRSLPSSGDDLKQFQTALEKGRLGMRNNQPIRKSMDSDVVSLLEDHGLFKPFANTQVTQHAAYIKPELTLSEQQELDEEILRVPIA